MLSVHGAGLRKEMGAAGWLVPAAPLVAADRDPAVVVTLAVRGVI